MLLHIDQFIQINSFLNKYKKVANKELLNYYPQNIGDYNLEWVNYLTRCDDHQLFSIDSENLSLKNAPDEFNHYLKTITQISHIPFIEQKSIKDLPLWAWQKVNQKKRHEIEHILSQNYNYQILIDICGGVGHTSRIHSHYYNRPSIVIDYDQKLIERGKKRFSKYPLPKDTNDITFINADLNDTNNIKNIIKSYKKPFFLGLHTCGPLAVNFINLNKDLRTNFLNFGCCYNRLDHQKDTSLSKLSNEYKYNFSAHSLTLATRSNFNKSRQDFDLKKRIKFYRYALALYLIQEKGISNFVKLGNSPLKLYRGDFQNYAKENLLKIGINSNNDNLNKFFSQNHIQTELNLMFCYTLIRWKLSRPLEVYLLLDRYFYLKEAGIKAQIFQYFDPSISPRNIGIKVNQH